MIKARLKISDSLRSEHGADIFCRVRGYNFTSAEYPINLANSAFDARIARMIERRLFKEVNQRLEQMPAVAILGPRQAGKTTLALQIADKQPCLYLDLQLDSDRARLADPAPYLKEHRDKLIILDEIHRVPELFSTLRAVIDANRRAGKRYAQFVILGSASPELLRQSGESLAGRLAYTELYGVDLLEARSTPPQYSSDQSDAETSTLNQLWTRGGFPDSFLASSDRSSLLWRRDFITAYLQRDIPDLGPAIASETLRRFWTMLAHLSGALLNRSTLARSLDVNATTVSRYLDLMVDLLLVRQLKPWHGNLGKRLVKSPKVYLRDTGILHALLAIDSREQLLGHPKLGDSFEGFVIEQLLSVTPSDTTSSFYRTAAGAEIDLVLEFGLQRWAIEIRHSSAPSPSRGFHEGCRDIQATRQIVIYPGMETYTVRNGVEVLPITQLMNELGERLCKGLG